MLTGKFWSLRHGFCSPLCGLWECFIWFGTLIKRTPREFATVQEAWCERSNFEIGLYGLGAGLFVSVMSGAIYVVRRLGFTPAQLEHFAVAQACIFFWLCLFSGLSLLIPVGAAVRYEVGNLVGRKTGYERMFLGQLPLRLLLAARGRGAVACLWENLMHLGVIVWGGAMTYYALYAGDDKRFELTSYGPPTSGLDWLYFSLLTLGFNDVGARSGVARTVATTEIVVGWMYMASLFPSLMSLVANREEGDGTGGGTPNRRSGPSVWTDAINGGKDALFRERRATANWGSPLNSDRLASWYASHALRKAEKHLGPRRIAEELANYVESLRGAEPADPVVEVLLACDADQTTSRAAKLKNALNQIGNLPPFENIGTLLGIAGRLVHGLTANEAAELMGKIDGEWDRRYGVHWGSYELVARLSAREFDRTDPETVGLLDELVSRQSPVGGAWFGDVILTSLCVLVLSCYQRDLNARLFGGSWLLETARSVGKRGLPVVANLDVWQTASVLDAVVAHNAPADAFDEEISWLAIKALGGPIARGWSWSSDGNTVCGDTTSLACSVLARINHYDVFVERARLDGLGQLVKLRVGPHAWATFGIEGGIDQACPIISARCVGMLPSIAERRTAAGVIMSEVVSGAWSSLWWTNPLISLGQSVYHAAPFVPPEDPIMAKAHAELSNAANKETTVEGLSSALLGLCCLYECRGTSRDTRKEIEKIGFSLLEQQSAEGNWTPSPCGVFGFGRCYVDPIRSTALAVKAVRHVQHVIG